MKGYKNIKGLAVVVASFVAFLASLVAIIAFFNSSIDKKIDDRLSDEKFQREIAEMMKTPYLIVTQSGTILQDDGGCALIDSVHFEYVETDNYDDHVVAKIFPKAFLPNPPTITCLTGTVNFREPIRTNIITLEYSSYPFAVFCSPEQGETPEPVYKIEFPR